ncbi:hypothetical protein ISF_02919 [Cordyceps fumosorosea ARSEF 2679]|uniref:Uncharacterized protein n=1 Tax=Cordyceps fumosorosea (strain ARSEF 2679) TaxID=1081104 RepID=A0A162MSK7_CORFA|nr:hypothetical protein ISF_02919 [Cordyceps fumosorosea ARSEF 2679]OAA69649.1 hypothetical protein ISF_02919 [Cordyceps fumosorosea ARSEF 2679]
MAMLAPPLSPQPAGGLFELPHKKWRRRRITSHLMRQEERDRAAREAEMESKARACNYLSTFLHSSPWSDQLEQITIVWDSVPPMEDLDSYGELDEEEGTRNCRRLFKAVVVWEEVGQLLWQTLRDTAQQRQPLDGTVSAVTQPPSTDGADAWWHAPPDYSFRRGSQETSHSSLTSRGSATASPLPFERDYSSFSSLSSSPCDPSFMAAAAQSRRRSDSLSAMIPRAISCVSAVRKTFGVFSEKQTA